MFLHCYNTVTTTLLKCENKTKLTLWDIHLRKRGDKRKKHACKKSKNTQLKIRQRKINKIGMNSSNQWRIYEHLYCCGVKSVRWDVYLLVVQPKHFMLIELFFFLIKRHSANISKPMMRGRPWRDRQHHQNKAW